MAKKKRVKKKKCDKQPIVNVPAAPVDVLVHVNELQIISVLMDDEILLTVMGGMALGTIKLRYQTHPSTTPAGLAQFWADVEQIARTKRRALEESPGSAKALFNRDMEQADEQKRHDMEDTAGYAVRTTQAAVTAVQTGSFIPPFMKKITAELDQQHKDQEILRLQGLERDAELKRLGEGRP